MSKPLAHNDVMNFIGYVAEKLTEKEMGDYTITIETEYGTCYTDEAQEVFDRYYDKIEDKFRNMLSLKFVDDLILFYSILSKVTYMNICYLPLLAYIFP